jgi:hypothetical protein
MRQQKSPPFALVVETSERPREPRQVSIRTQSMKHTTKFYVANFGLLIWAVAALGATPPTALAADTGCYVVDGYAAEVALGPNLPADRAVRMKSTFKAEFRWEMSDKESVGWMRIVDEAGVEVGWVPAGNDAVRCGKTD